MSGYVITRDREEAPRRMLGLRGTRAVELLDLRPRGGRRAERGMDADADDAPVPVQLREHGEPRGQLRREERDGLARHDVPAREGTRFGALCVGWVHVSNVSVAPKERSGPACAPTALSRFLSQRSLIVHPAPRIINAPVPKSAMYFRGTDGGASSAYEAMVIDQAVMEKSGCVVRRDAAGTEAVWRRTAGIK